MPGKDDGCGVSGAGGVKLGRWQVEWKGEWKMDH